MKKFSFSFDKAFDSVIDGIEQSVVDRARAAASDLLTEEYKAPPSGAAAASAPADLGKLQDVAGFWRLFDLQRRKADIQAQLEAISRGDGRAGESAAKAFSELAATLGQAPDPQPYLIAFGPLQQRIGELQRENRRLQLHEQAAESEASSASQAVIRSRELGRENADLKAQLKDRAEKEAQIGVDLSSLEKVQKEAAADRMQLEGELKQLRGEHSSLRAEHERVQSCLFDLKESREAASNASAAADDFERQLEETLTQQVRSLQLEKEQLEERLNGLRADSLSKQADSAPAPAASPRGTAVLSALRAENEHLKHQLKETQAQQGASQAETAAALAAAQQQCTSLQQELAGKTSQADMQALRQRVEALRLLVDSREEEADVAGDEQSSPTSAASLHAVLQGRNRRLASDVQSLQRQLDAKDAAMSQMQDRIRQNEGDMKSKDTLVKQLEDDIFRSKQISEAATEQLEAAQQGHADAGAARSQKAADPLLGIVISQRDRFRARVDQLEREAAGIGQELQGLQSELSGARTDNVQLYEKIRYLQSYQAKQAGASDSAYQIVQVDSDGIPQAKEPQRHRLQCGPLHIKFGASPERQAASALPTASAPGMRARGGQKRSACFGFGEADDEEAARSAAEQRYLKAYEARFNPWAEFQQSEEASRVKALPVHDRALLSGSKALLGSRLGRAFAAVYLALIHAFMFALIYYAALSSQPVVIAAASDPAASVSPPP